MLAKNAENRGQLEFVSLETMVPQDHLLRKIEAAIDFKKIYEFVEGLYCEDNGRPSIDPVALFKIVLIQHIYGIPSLRRTLEEVSMNLAYRWFIGYPLTEAVPHFSTVSYNFKHRFNHATVEYVFRWVLKAAAEEGYLDTEAIFVDGTHIKASANLKKQAKKAVSKQAKRYAKELFNEVNKEREEHGKKPFSDDSDKKPPQERETKETVVSTTDPESGVFHKGEHKKCFAYEAHIACDNHNFVLGVHVTPGNIHDSVAFDPLYDELCRDYPEHKIVVADSAYKTPWICKRIVVHSDINRADNVQKNPERVKRLMRSYARNQGGQVPNTVLAQDIAANDETPISEETVASYVSALRKIFVVEDMPAWNPNLRSKTAIRSSDTRYYIDPSIAAAALGIGPNDLINDLNTFGFLFETLCIRDLRVFADALNGEVYHYRDKDGQECDAVVHLRNGNYGLIEIKLGGDRLIEEGAKSLKSMEAKIDTDKMNTPSFLMVLTGTGDYAYRRQDGVYVVPIGCLRN